MPPVGMVRASPFGEVPIPDIVWVAYSPGPLSYVFTIVIPAGVVPASVATMPPPPPPESWPAEGGHGTMFSSVRGYGYMRAASGARWGWSVSCPPKCSRRWVGSAGPGSDGRAPGVCMAMSREPR